jgi:hypothetical protein
MCWIQKALFLGGKDIIENLKISDIDVYWNIMGQVIKKLTEAGLNTSKNYSIIKCYGAAR